MKAVIPIAGVGSRLFPATRVIPKPFFPLIDPRDGFPKPAIHLIVEEAVRSGVNGVCIVLHPSQRKLVQDYFFNNDYPNSFPAHNNHISQIKRLANFITLTNQDELLGFGHAVYCSRSFVGNNPFLVFLGDHVYTSPNAEKTCGSYLIDAFNKLQGSITSVGICKEDELTTNGVLKCHAERLPQSSNILQILDMSEKPTKEFAAIQLVSKNILKTGEYFCNFGIDVLTPSIFDILEKNIAGNKDKKEVQLREAMKELWKTQGMHALFLPEAVRHDFGIPAEYQKTFLNFSIRKRLEYKKELIPPSLQVDVNMFITKIEKQHQLFFAQDSTVFIARSPGRLDVMGGIADYSGCTVLQLPIKEGTFVALQVKKTGSSSLKVHRHIESTALNDAENMVSVSMDNISKFMSMPYSEIRQFFKSNFASTPWIAYICGVIIVFAKEIDPIILHQEFRIVVSSSVPECKGVSSSAAIEVALGHALERAFNLTITSENMALLCQKAENMVVGAACGVMDQVATTYGAESHFTTFVCQPIQDIRNVSKPQQIGIWGLNSGISRNVSGSAYTNARIGAFMGYRIICEVDKRKFSQIQEGMVAVDDEEWRGYLANITPETFETRYRKHVPYNMSGKEFLEKFHGFTDKVTRIDPTINYEILPDTLHPVYENARIKSFISCLTDIQKATASIREILLEMGQKMYESHRSYSACGLGSSHTDFLVELVQKFGPARDLYGAKVTGGGGGGTVAVLGLNTPRAKNTIAQIQKLYEQKTGVFPQLFSGSSIGAKQFGVVVAQWI